MLATSSFVTSRDLSSNLSIHELVVCSSKFAVFFVDVVNSVDLTQFPMVSPQQKRSLLLFSCILICPCTSRMYHAIPFSSSTRRRPVRMLRPSHKVHWSILITFWTLKFLLSGDCQLLGRDAQSYESECQSKVGCSYTLRYGCDADLLYCAMQCALRGWKDCGRFA